MYEKTLKVVHVVQNQISIGLNPNSQVLFLCVLSITFLSLSQYMLLTTYSSGIGLWGLALKRADSYIIRPLTALGSSLAWRTSEIRSFILLVEGLVVRRYLHVFCPILLNNQLDRSAVFLQGSWNAYTKKKSSGIISFKKSVNKYLSYRTETKSWRTDGRTTDGQTDRQTNRRPTRKHTTPPLTCDGI